MRIEYAKCEVEGYPFGELCDGVEVNGYETEKSRAYWVDWQYGENTDAEIIEKGFAIR